MRNLRDLSKGVVKPPDLPVKRMSLNDTTGAIAYTCVSYDTNEGQDGVAPNKRYYITKHYITISPPRKRLIHKKVIR